jgi:hypothetical protein
MAAASTGALAAERERLEREIAELSKGLPPEAAQIVQAADALMTQHAERMQALKAARDKIDQAFGVKRREAEEAAERARAEEDERLRAALLAAEERRLQVCERAERSWRIAIADTSELFAAHENVLKAKGAITGGARSPDAAMGAMGIFEFVRRTSGRICSLLKTLRVPGTLPGTVHRIGELELPNSSHFPADQSWTEREAEIAAPMIETLTGTQG